VQVEKLKPVRPRVIVRAWGDEPVALFLHRIDSTACYVGQECSATTIGLPHEQVFVFDKMTFSRLRRAYARRQRAKLSSMYSDLYVEKSACNRYQNMLESGHDKENITDSQRLARGSERRKVRRGVS